MSFIKLTDIGVDGVINSVAGIIVFELADIQANLLSVLSENIQRRGRADPTVLVFIQLIVHLPELPLQAGGFSGSGAGKGVLVDGGQRQIAELEVDIIVILGGDLLERLIVCFADWALIIAVLN